MRLRLRLRRPGSRSARSTAAAGPVSRSRPQPAARPAPARPLPAQRYRRRRLAAALAALLLFVALGLTSRILLYDLGLADVQDVRVTGAAVVPQRAVLEAAAVTPGGPLAAVDLAGVADRVSRLPVVESVRVGRGWPHTVAVDITERVPVAVTRNAEGARLVDRTGVVYPGDAVEGLPTLTVPSAGTDDPDTLAAVAVLDALPAQVRPQVLNVRVEEPDLGSGTPAAGSSSTTPQVTLGLTEDREIRWGGPERAAEKAAVLLPLLGQTGRRYDVSSPELPTIRP